MENEREGRVVVTGPGRVTLHLGRIGCATRLAAMGVEHIGDTIRREVVLQRVHGIREGERGGSTTVVGSLVGRRMGTRGKRVNELGGDRKRGGGTAIRWNVVVEIKSQRGNRPRAKRKEEGCEGECKATFKRFSARRFNTLLILSRSTEPNKTKTKERKTIYAR